MAEYKTIPIVPFLKWAGGKRWLVRKGFKVAPPNYDRYIEPFLGGAAVFFSLPTKPFIISDINEELIDCYKAIRQDWKSVKDILLLHQLKHSDTYYYETRNSRPTDAFTRAARFIYLNRTCWNGLYRVNLKGEFNVPRGTKTRVLLDTDDFEQVARKLAGGRLLCQDFEETLSQAGDQDFVFVDPPYTVRHNHNGFLKYNDKVFSWEDQKRLRKAVEEAASRGALITMTNADHESIHRLYNGVCEIEKIKRSSVIAADSSQRGLTSEILVRIGWRE